MRFLIAKKDTLVCYKCKTNILRGEEMTLNFISTPTFRRTLFFHIQCYIDWYTEKYINKWRAWKLGTGNNPEPPQRGRPVQYTDPTKEQRLNRLRSALSYHKKHFHGTKVESIKKRIQVLTSL